MDDDNFQAYKQPKSSKVREELENALYDGGVEDEDGGFEDKDVELIKMAKLNEAKTASIFDTFTVLASIYYVREAYRIKGWKPFTA